MSGMTGGEKGNGEREPVSVTVTLALVRLSAVA